MGQCLENPWVSIIEVLAETLVETLAETIFRKSLNKKWPAKKKKKPEMSRTYVFFFLKIAIS